MYKIEIRTLPISEPNTKSMQANIQISMAVSPSAFGELVVMLLKMLIKTRNNVMSNAIRPEIKSGYITNCNICLSVPIILDHFGWKPQKVSFWQLHIVWKLLLMSLLLAFSTNFCPLTSDFFCDFQTLWTWRAMGTMLKNLRKLVLM